MFVTDGERTMQLPKGCEFFHPDLDPDDPVLIPFELEDYYMQKPEMMSDYQLHRSILFWDFLGHRQILAECLYEYIFTRKLKDPLHPVLDEYLVPVYKREFFGKKGYDELSKMYGEHLIHYSL